MDHSFFHVSGFVWYLLLFVLGHSLGDRFFGSSCLGLFVIATSVILLFGLLRSHLCLAFEQPPCARPPIQETSRRIKSPTSGFILWDIRYLHLDVSVRGEGRHRQDWLKWFQAFVRLRALQSHHPQRCLSSTTAAIQFFIHSINACVGNGLAFVYAGYLRAASHLATQFERQDAVAIPVEHLPSVCFTYKRGGKVNEQGTPSFSTALFVKSCLKMALPSSAALSNF